MVDETKQSDIDYRHYYLCKAASDSLNELFEAGLLSDFLEKNLKVEINKEFCDTYLKEFKDLKVPVTFYLKDKL